MRLAAAALAILFAGCTAPAAAQTPSAHPPEGIVWVALRDINAAYFDADDPTNRPPLATSAPEGMIRAVVVSDDGKPDWLIDYDAAGLSQFCGTGGCLQRLYVSDGDAYVRALDNQALDLTIADGRVEAWVHHLYCADDNRDCRYIYMWDAAALRLAERSTNSARPMGDEAYRPLPPATD